jgi:hypothetical protein
MTDKNVRQQYETFLDQRDKMFHKFEGAKLKIIAMAIRHRNEAECGPNPPGFECRICAAVEAFGEMVGEDGLMALTEMYK